MFTKTLYTLHTDNGFRVFEVMPIFQKSEKGQLCMPENYIIHEQLLQIEHTPRYSVASDLVFLGALIVPLDNCHWAWYGKAPDLSNQQFEEIVSFIRYFKLPHLKDIGNMANP